MISFFVVSCVEQKHKKMFLYEEFMARSSTRAALRKDSNFVSMMNVLIQLRKVCNHPDLFEPRSIVTPFFTHPSLSVDVPGFCLLGGHGNGCIHDNCDENDDVDDRRRATTAMDTAATTGGPSALYRISSNLRCPLWSFGCGHPSPRESKRHDAFRAESLQRLSPPLCGDVEKKNDVTTEGGMVLSGGLRSFLEGIEVVSAKRRLEASRFRSEINRRRCLYDGERSFPYPQRLLDLLHVDLRPFGTDDDYDDDAYDDEDDVVHSSHDNNEGDKERNKEKDKEKERKMDDGVKDMNHTTTIQRPPQQQQKQQPSQQQQQQSTQENYC